jgi:hypothetical protein
VPAELGAFAQAARVRASARPGGYPYGVVTETIPYGSLLVGAFACHHDRTVKPDGTVQYGCYDAVTLVYQAAATPEPPMPAKTDWGAIAAGTAAIAVVVAGFLTVIRTSPARAAR